MPPPIPRQYWLSALAAILLAAGITATYHFARPLSIASAAPPADRIVISIPDRKLVVLKSGEPPRVYPIAVGKPATPTPAGVFHLSHLESDPDSSPTGVRWMEFFREKTPGGGTMLYGIHGTNAPASIGGAVSHGCIRLNNHDIVEVFRDAYEGEPVEIVNLPLNQIPGLAR